MWRPRFVRVHALFESTPCSSPRFLTRPPVVQTAHSHFFKKPRLFSVHACSPSTLVRVPPALFFFNFCGRRRRPAGPGACGGGFGAPGPAAKIEKKKMGENLEFRRKSRISAKISDFGENFGCRPKSRISSKISDFVENFEFRRKS